jgi:hypothetical protein
MIFINNKYTIWYYSIVTNAQSRILPKDTYVEKHHIVPRSLGGQENKTNLVKLTAREHFVCHLLLTKMVTGPNRYRMLSAVTKFQQARKYQHRALTSWEYKKLRECAIEARTGQKHTDQAKQKIKDKHHDVSGKNNPKARRIQATDPNGTTYEIIGGLKKFCQSRGLGYSTVLRLISIHPKWNRTYNGSTAGWSFKHLD